MCVCMCVHVCVYVSVLKGSVCVWECTCLWREGICQCAKSVKGGRVEGKMYEWVYGVCVCVCVCERESEKGRESV